MRTLLIEDDQSLAQIVKQSAFQHGHLIVDIAATIHQAIEMIEIQSYDSIIVDINLPDGLGCEIIKYLSQNNLNIPTIAITGNSEDEMAVKCLNKGFDDYLSKPFSVLELTQRINVLHRTTNKPTHNIESIKDLTLDYNKLTISNKTNSILITKTEYNILKYLFENYPREISAKSLIQQIWDQNGDQSKAKLHTAISRLKSKTAQIKPNIINYNFKGYILNI